MPGDAVTLDGSKLEITRSVEQRGLPMSEPVQAVRAVVPLMPVVQEVIVQQSGAHERTLIDPVPQAHPVRQPYAQACHSDGMGERRDHAMLVTVLFDAHMLVLDDFLTMVLDNALDLGAVEHVRQAIPELCTQCRRCVTVRNGEAPP